MTGRQPKHGSGRGQRASQLLARVDARRWRPFALVAVLVAALALVAEARTAAGQQALARIGTAPQLPEAVDLGAAPASAEVSGELVLRPRSEAALEGFIEAATTRGSPSFGQYLGRGQFASRFGPAASTVAAVSAQLRGAGLSVKSSESEPLLVRFSGSSAAADKAFATSVHTFKLSSGETVQATTSAPALPSQLAGAVAAVVGLDQLPASRPMRIRRSVGEAARFAAASAATFKHPSGSPDACPQARKAAAEFGGLTDDDIANAYGAFGLYGVGDTGAGVHIGVFEEEPFSRSDIEHFDSCYFGATAATAMQERLQVIELEGGVFKGPGEDGEALLDVEDVSAMAPGADIDVYEIAEKASEPEAAGNELTEIAAMVDEDRDQIITSSYGQACEEEQQEGQPGMQEALNFLFEQGAAQGQTFLGAAGDNGSDNCEEAHREPVPQPGQNPLSGGEIASQPYVIGVGGTTITDATQPISEHVWNDGPFGGAGGGGISESFAMPSWQRAATVPGIDLPGSEDYAQAAIVEKRFGFPTGFCDDTLQSAPNTPCRLEPDVSAQSDEYTGAVTVYSEEYRGNGGGLEERPDGWVTSGGTSSGTPIWAGMLALADASPTCRENPATASGVGFILPLLYGIASNASSYAASFNDVTEGNNDQYGLDDGKVFPARTGFDLASGLGSPRLTGPGGSAGLAYYLCSYAGEAAKPAIAGLTPASGSVGGGEKVTISGVNLGEVASAQVGNWLAPPSALHVLGPTALELQMPPASETLPSATPPPQDGAGPAQVTVTLKGGQSSAAGPASVFQYFDSDSHGSIPSVTGVIPSGGSETAPTPVTILGGDLEGASSVTFGGVAASTFKVLSDSEISVTPPAYSSQTACAPLPSGGVYAGEDPDNDICQVQVVVHDSHGASTTGTILAPFEGTQTFQQDGALEAPPGCGCEVYPSPTEYDYAPAPVISSVSTSEGPAEMASEKGGTLITIHGSGLSRFTFDYTSFGEPQLESSADLEVPVYISGTEIQIPAPGLPEHEEASTVEAQSVPLTVRTLAGDSVAASVRYAGVPRVTSVLNSASSTRLNGLYGALDTGGTPIVLKGRGLAGQVAFVHFDAEEEEYSDGTQYTLVGAGEGRLDTQTVSQNPALVHVEACTVSGCSAPSAGAQLYLYPPGQSKVERLSPASGKAAGGTKVVIRGQNLACPLAVSFGNVAASSFAPGQPGPCDSPTSSVDAVSPAGAAKTRVPVTVSTWESYFTGSGDAPTTALFTYK
jgi:hypothetical protein